MQSPNLESPTQKSINTPSKSNLSSSPNSNQRDNESFYFMFFVKWIALNIPLSQSRPDVLHGRIRFQIYKGVQLMNGTKQYIALDLTQGWCKIQKVQLCFFLKNYNSRRQFDFIAKIFKKSEDQSSQQQIGQIHLNANKYIDSYSQWNQTQTNNKQLQLQVQQLSQRSSSVAININKIQQNQQFGDYKMGFLIFTSKTRHDLEKVVKSYKSIQQNQQNTGSPINYNNINTNLIATTNTNQNQPSNFTTEQLAIHTPNKEPEQQQQQQQQQQLTEAQLQAQTNNSPNSLVKQQEATPINIKINTVQQIEQNTNNQQLQSNKKQSQIVYKQDIHNEEQVGPQKEQQKETQINRVQNQSSNLDLHEQSVKQQQQPQQQKQTNMQISKTFKRTKDYYEPVTNQQQQTYKIPQKQTHTHTQQKQQLSSPQIRIHESSIALNQSLNKKISSNSNILEQLVQDIEQYENKEKQNVNILDEQATQQVCIEKIIQKEKVKTVKNDNEKQKHTQKQKQANLVSKPNRQSQPLIKYTTEQIFYPNGDSQKVRYFKIAVIVILLCLIVFFIAHQYGFFGREEVVMKRAIKKSDRIRNRESVNVAKNANMNNVGQTKSSSKNVQENSKNTEKQKKSNEKTKKKSSSVKKQIKNQSKQKKK